MVVDNFGLNLLALHSVSWASRFMSFCQFFCFQAIFLWIFFGPIFSLCVSHDISVILQVSEVLFSLFSYLPSAVQVGSFLLFYLQAQSLSSDISFSSVREPTCEFLNLAYFFFSSFISIEFFFLELVFLLWDFPFFFFLSFQLFQEYL